MLFHASAETVIAKAIDAWVDAECITSSTDHNAILDDFEHMRLQLGLDPHDPQNHQASKYFSHHNRQRFWGEAFIAEPENDYFAARHIFNGLMAASGTRRKMSYMSAASANEYTTQRQAKTGSNIDTAKRVQATLASQPLGVSAAEAQAISIQAFEKCRTVLDDLRQRVPQDFGKESSPAIDLLKELQGDWIHVVTSGIQAAARYRGNDLTRVPFLEPKSITNDPDVYYPFA